jgi:hypothetical protein
MGRRKREDAIFEASVSLIALIGLGMVFVPPFRQLIVVLGFITIMLLVVAVVVILVIRQFKKRPPAPSPPPLTGYYTSPHQPRTNNPIIEYAPPVPEPVDLLKQLRALDWFQFEKLVELTYQKLGYSVTRRGGANPDGGIDLVIERGGLKKAVQCKQWKSWNVGVKPVREFLGALTDSGIPNGIFVTVGSYTADAKTLAEKHGIEMLNETLLVQMLESVNASHDPEVLALLQDPRKFCPKCEREMVLRTAKKGLRAGNQFWGCSSYPECEGKLPV